MMRWFSCLMIFLSTCAFAAKTEAGWTLFELDRVREALNRYASDIGQLPDSSCGLDCLKSNLNHKAGWHGPYLEESDQLLDGFGFRLKYRPKPENGYLLYSVGPGGMDDLGGGDDLLPADDSFLGYSPIKLTLAFVLVLLFVGGVYLSRSRP